MRHPLLLAAVLALLALAGCVCGDDASHHFDGGMSPPQPLTCSSGYVDGLEIGASDADSFRPLVDGATVPLVYGPQGGTMIGIRLRATGSGVPSCVPEETVVEDDLGRELVHETLDVNVNADPSGGKTTDTMMLVLDGPFPGHGASLHVRSTVGSATTQITVFTE